MTTAQVNWSAIREVPPGVLGEPRGYCEGCGLYLWGEGGLKIPGLRGRHCSILCAEVDICARSGNRKRVEGVRLGDGQTLLAYLRARSPSTWEMLTGLTAHSARPRLRPQPASAKKLAALEKARLARSGKSKNADFVSLKSVTYSEPIGASAISPSPRDSAGLLGFK